MELPNSLKHLAPFLQHAKQIGVHEPVMAYYCRYHAVNLGTKKYHETRDPDVKNTLLVLLDKLEEDKKALGDKLKSPEMKAPYVIEFTDKIFDKADKEDREGKHTKATALGFYAASIFYETLSIFLEDGQSLDEQVAEKIKYSKFKAQDINNAFKLGKKPTPGPPKKIEFPAVVQTELPKIANEPERKDSPPVTAKVEEKPAQAASAPTAEEKKAEEPKKKEMPVTYTQSPYDTCGIPPENIDLAHKYARHAVSALQFDDSMNAVTELKKALNSLGVYCP